MQMWTLACCLFSSACAPAQHPDPHDKGATIVVLPNTQQTPKGPVEIAGDEPETTIAAEDSAMTDAKLSAMVQDPRRERWSPRRRPLLVSELQSLEALFAAAPSSSPDRPLLMRRLAYDYDELKFAARQDKQQGVIDGGRNKSEQARHLDVLASAAQKMAAKYYQMIDQQHPTFCQTRNATDPAKSKGCIDDVLYFGGLEQAEMGSLDQARRTFFKLVKDFPQSPWIPYAYLGFGELFLAEAVADPSKRELARLSYSEVIKRPPPENDTYGFAQYRLGQVFQQEQVHQKALAHFVKAIEFSNDFPNLRPSAALGQLARRGIVSSFANAGAPSKAEIFFQRLANDPPGSNERLIAMLDALVAEYLRDNKRVEANEVCFAFSGGGNAIPSCRSIAALQPSP
jgi:tetratricopeptide (TPR) repeat protein